MKKLNFILSLILFLELFVGKNYNFEINNITYYENSTEEIIENKTDYKTSDDSKSDYSNTQVLEQEDNNVIEETKKIDIAIKQNDSDNSVKWSNYKEEEKLLKNKLLIILTGLCTCLTICIIYILFKRK
ncbi:MAG: hypothetical protein IJ134_00505 [Bacilli bacterium]|nr:hypothetical protein [Bacilli bacterium]